MLPRYVAKVVNKRVVAEAAADAVSLAAAVAYPEDVVAAAAAEASRVDERVVAEVALVGAGVVVDSVHVALELVLALVHCL